jgi:hypothetical protein
VICCEKERESFGSKVTVGRAALSFRTFGEKQATQLPCIVLAGLIFDLVPLLSFWEGKAKQRPLQLESSLDQILEKTVIVSKEGQETGDKNGKRERRHGTYIL